MANFKESYRLERVYFEKLKSMISILKSFLDNETDEKTRAILANEIDDNGAILLLYRNLGEAWAELADLIQKLRNDLNDLNEKEEAYHDELNERIDEVNNYLMALIRALEERMDAVEADLAQMGRLFTYDLAETSGVYSLAESGTTVTFAATVSKLTHVRPHFVSVRNGSKYYLIDTYDLTDGTGSVTWSGFEFTPTGEIKETIVTLAADNSVTVTQTSTNFAAILSRLTAIETKITNFGDLPANANAEIGDVLTVGANHLNVWAKAKGTIYVDGEYDADAGEVGKILLTYNNAPITIKTIYDYLVSGVNVKIKLHSFFNGSLYAYPPFTDLRIFDIRSFTTYQQIVDPDDPESETFNVNFITWKFNTLPIENRYYSDPLSAMPSAGSEDLFVIEGYGTDDGLQDYVKVTYRNMCGIDAIFAGNAFTEGNDINQIMGLSLKERSLLYPYSIGFPPIIAYLRRLDENTGETFQYPLVKYNLTDSGTYYEYELYFYDYANINGLIKVRWRYNYNTDTETIRIF